LNLASSTSVDIDSIASFSFSAPITALNISSLHYIL
jgi:hypothetical protein